MSETNNATNWGDMKRVLVNVEADIHGERFDAEMQKAVDALLKPTLQSYLTSADIFVQEILEWDTRRTVGVAPPCEWLPRKPGACPSQFVLCAPREWFREDVPDYTGPIKGEKVGAQ